MKPQKRLMRVPMTARRWNQSILKEINPEYSLEGLVLKLKLQNFGHLMWRADSLEKTQMLGKIENKRRKGMTEDELIGWMASLIQWTWVWANIGKLWNREAWSAAVHGVTKSWIWLSDWTTMEYYGGKIKSYPSDWIYGIIVKVIDYPWVWAQQMLKLLGGRQSCEIVFWERTNMLI